MPVGWRHASEFTCRSPIGKTLGDMRWNWTGSGTLSIKIALDSIVSGRPARHSERASGNSKSSWTHFYSKSIPKDRTNHRLIADWRILQSAMTDDPVLHGIRAIVFDAVGTVIHPLPPAPVLYAEVGRRFGSNRIAAEIAPRFIAAFARAEAIDYANGLRTGETREIERWRRIVGQVLDDVRDQDACFLELFEHFSRPEAWRCDPDAAATIETLAQRGYALGMASNYDQRLRSVVAGLPALRPLQHLIISSEVGWRKPAPQFFLAVCRAFDLIPERILYVGDDLANDFEGARAAGLRSVLLDPKGKHQGHEPPPIRALRELAAS